MNRRIFIGTLASGLLVAPLAADAQPAGKVWRLGILSPSTTASEAARRQSPLMRRLVELGYIENQNLVVEYRAAEGTIDRLSDLAVELVQAKVDAIFTASSPGVQAARKWRAMFFSLPPPRPTPALPTVPNGRQATSRRAG